MTRRVSSIALSVLLATTIGLVSPDVPVAASSSPARLPANFHISLPWAAGTERVTCGYHPACSVWHSGVDRTLSTNDEYGLDFGLPKGTPVLAVASGRVKWAGWYNSSGTWHNYGNSVSIAHYGAGTGFTSFYARLSKIVVKSGQPVAAGQVIGYVGATGTEGGFHLHFAMYYNPGGAHVLRTPTTSPPYGGIAALPEPFSNCQKTGGSVCSGLAAGNALRPVAPINPTPTAGQQVPAAPSNGTAAALDASRIRVTWSDNSTNEQGIYLSDNLTSVTLAAGTTSYEWGGLTPGTYKCFRVSAFNSAGQSAWTNWACTTTPLGPTPSPSASPTAPPGPLPTFANVDEELRVCPTAAEVQSVNSDLRLTFDTDPSAGTFVCTSAGGSADLTKVQAATYHAILVMRHLAFNAPLPWTANLLYAWFVSAIRGVHVTGTGTYSFCCETGPTIVIVVKSNSYALLTTQWMNAQMGGGIADYLAVMIHEARHAEGGHPHTCGDLDTTLSELGAWGVEYYYYVSLAQHSDPSFVGGPDESPAGYYATTAGGDAAWLLHTHFCSPT